MGDLPTSISFPDTGQQSQNRNGDSPNNPCYSNCVSRLLLLLLMWLLILSSAVLIAWLVVDPHDPDFRLSSLSVSNVSLSDSNFAAIYDIEFALNNTNKKASLCIEYVRVAVFYDKGMVSEKVLEQTVYVGKMSRAKFVAELKTNSVRSVKKKVFKDLSDAWSKKMVTFHVQMFVRNRFEYGVLPTKLRFLSVSCLNLPVEFLSTKGIGKLMIGGKACLVH